MAILTVTTRADEAFDGGEPTASTDGQGLSLREAIALANSGDTITFDASLSGQTILLGDANGDGVVSGGEVATELGINKALTIDGDLDDDMSADISLDGAGSSRILYVFGSDYDLNLNGLNFQNANVINETGKAFPNKGGAIYSTLSGGDVEIQNSAFSDNYADHGGGAISLMFGDTLRIDNTTFSNNGAGEGNGYDSGGGAIYVDYASLVVSDSVFEGNESYIGGAIVSYSYDVEIVSTIFQNNSSAGDGGALFVERASSVSVSSSLFLGNSADINGGGAEVSASDVQIINSFFVANSSGNGEPDTAGLGALYISDVPWTSTDGQILNSVFLDNRAFEGGHNDLVWYADQDSAVALVNSVFFQTVPIAQGYATASIRYPDFTGGSGVFPSYPTASVPVFKNNYFYSLDDMDGALVRLIMDDDNANILAVDYDPSSFFSNDLIPGTPDPMLGPLQDNGGPVPTIALLPGSPLIDAGTATLPDGVMLPLIDALGAARIVGVAVDMGAVEFVLAAEDDPTEEDDVSTVPSEGDDAIQLGILDREVFGGAGHDRIDGSPVSEAIFGNLDNDTLTGGAGEDSLFGGQGDDYIEGNTGFDLLFGNRGNDQLYGGKDNDVLYGNQSEDTLFGGVADDVLFGGQGNDALYGEDGNDQLLGNKGDDTLIAGNGDDILTGGAGNDMFVGLGGADVYIIRAMEGDDVIVDYQRDQGDVIAGGAFSAASQVSVIETGLVLTSADGSTLTLMGVTDLDDVLFL
ncbi:MAG: hypothetical protein CL559_14140 [Alphaproteobacteria bacterium]|nr:hypothetical protein [Alphaproteobacteria bacterium]